MSEYQYQSSRVLYLDYIQTLRAIAVLMVFFYHLNINIFSKGYLGVDIFFVISGYVITKQLEERFFINNKLEIKKFFLKRILKIVPVYFFIITIVFLTFVFFGPLTEYDFYRDKIKFIYFFVSNFYYQNLNKSYFDNIFDDPLNHTWSLGVEMQFYLAFPIFFYFLKKNLKQELIIKILLFTISISIAAIIYLSENKNLIFYSPFFRAWEFFQGSLVYFLTKISSKNDKKKTIIEEKKSWLIFLLITITIFFPNKENLVFNQFIIVFLTSLFIFFKKNKTSFFFSNKFLVYIGNISYSFYLWHLPVIYFSNIYLKSENNVIFNFFCTTLLSHLSYVYIENKFKKFDLKSIEINIFSKVHLLTFFILVVGIYFFQKTFDLNYFKRFILKNNYLEKEFSLTKRLNYTEIKINNNELYKFCTDNSKKYSINYFGLKNECFKFFNTENLIYIEGNSHAAIFVPLISKSLKESIYYKNNTNFNTNNSYSTQEVNNQLKYFKNIYYVRSINNISELNEFKGNYNKFDKKIIFLIIGPVPNFYDEDLKPVKCLINNKDCSFDLSVDYKNRNLDYLFEQLSKLNDELKNNKILIYNPYKVICQSNKCFIHKINEDFLSYRDNNHLTIEGSLTLNNDFNLFLKKNKF